MRNESNCQLVRQKGKQIEGDTIARLFTTRHTGGIIATTAVHTTNFTHRIGGVRMLVVDDPGDHGAREREAAKLAIAMTRKNAAAGLPCDGQKTVIDCPGSVPATFEARASVLAEHIAQIVDYDSGMIFGPDVAVPEEVQNILSKLPTTRDHVTGLSADHGGFGIDKMGYTAAGLMKAFTTLLNLNGWSVQDFSRGVLIQGFGAVGKHIAKRLDEKGFPICGVSTLSGSIRAANGQRLNVQRLLILQERYGDQAVDRYAQEFDLDLMSPDAVLQQGFDLFVPAAGIDVIATHQESAKTSAINAEDWRMRPKVILEGANDPITHSAETVLAENGVTILPDYIVNCGGLIGCLAEWTFRKDLLKSKATLKKLHRQTLEVIERIVERNVKECLESGLSPRQAARSLSDQRIREQREMWSRLRRECEPRTAMRRWLEAILEAKSAAYA